MDKDTQARDRYHRAHDELDQYVEIQADQLRATDSPSGAGSMLVYCLDQLDLDGLDPSGEWHKTNAKRLEAVIDTARAACGDEYPLDPRAIASRVHLRMAGGFVPLPKRSRFGQWHSTGAGVLCSCGRSVWAWTMIEDAEPVASVLPIEIGGIVWHWWRVCCRRCQLAIVLLYPGDELQRESMDQTFRSVVSSFTDSPGAPVVRYGTQAGKPHQDPPPARCKGGRLPTLLGVEDE